MRVKTALASQISLVAFGVFSTSAFATIVNDTCYPMRVQATRKWDCRVTMAPGGIADHDIYETRSINGSGSPVLLGINRLPEILSGTSAIVFPEKTTYTDSSVLLQPGDTLVFTVTQIVQNVINSFGMANHAGSVSVSLVGWNTQS